MVSKSKKTLSESIIPYHESEQVELKSSFGNQDQIVEAICALANRRGGIIWVGVSESKDGTRIKGVDIGKNTVEAFVNKVVREIEPVLYPEIIILMLNQKTILKIKVNEGYEKPYTASGRPFIRVGKNTKRMTQAEYQNLLYQRDKFYYDQQVARGARLDDINSEKVRLVLKLARTERNLDIPENTPVKAFLKKLNLIKREKLTNAAVLLFSKDPQRSFVQAEVRCARFKGGKSSDPFIDMKVLGGGVYEQIDEAEKFVTRNIEKSAWIEPGRPKRQEKWEYPLDAIREAIANAVVHRDYTSTSNVQVRIFDDRLEVWNPGRLPSGLSIQKLKDEHESEPRNPLIAKVLFLIRYIEQWGTGTTKIVSLCKSHGLPQPKFEQRANSFIVTFKKAKLHVDSRKTKFDLTFEGLNTTQIRMLEYVQMQGHVKGADLERSLKLPRRTITYYLRMLSGKYLKWHGKSRRDPTGYYTLIREKAFAK